MNPRATWSSERNSKRFDHHATLTDLKTDSKGIWQDDVLDMGNGFET